MAWDFLFVVRRLYKGADEWGRMYIKNSSDEWEFLSYTYELPWKEDRRGRSLSKKSRIKEGSYEMNVRTDGPKGWRLELLETGSRRNIQVHRAHKSMYIEGCILPVHFEDFVDRTTDVVSVVKKGQQVIQKRSVELMGQIRERYDQLSAIHEGSPTITLSALLPAMHRITTQASAYA
jgi:hypothetical protein